MVSTAFNSEESFTLIVSITCTWRSVPRIQNQKMVMDILLGFVDHVQCIEFES